MSSSSSHNLHLPDLSSGGHLKAQTQPPSLARGVVVLPAVPVAVAVLLAILGLVTIWSSVMALWALWTTDALKSIGMVIPVASFLLVLRAWRSIGWELEGSWWGFLILVLTALLVRLRDQSVLVLILSPRWSVFFPPHALVLCAYGTGVALLFGGLRLVRASAFPLLLLLFANPIPHVFNVLVDLPLQNASAHVARAFAHSLGQPLTPDKLRLMFTPDFGMFIAPGCNGIRGSVTMGLIALIAGYLYRFRWIWLAPLVVAAVALGYLFNLLRLCILVLYYCVALHFPSLQQHGTGIDYVIGGTLFFIAVFSLYTVIQHFGQAPEPLLQRIETAPARVIARGFAPRAVAMALLTLLCSAVLVHSLRAQPAPLATDSSVSPFPQTAGAYTLIRTWEEQIPAGPLLFHWAEYAAADPSQPHVSLGISPVLGSHDTLICHSARGEDPLWHGQQLLQTKAEPISFSTSFFNNGITQSLEATTLCNGSSCGEYSTPPARFGFVWSKPHPEAFFAQDPERPIPILLKAETLDLTLPASTARAQLSESVSSFLAGVDLDALTQPYRRH